MRKGTCVSTILAVGIVLASAAGPVSAQDLAFPTGQTVVVDATTSNTFWVVEWNYTAGTGALYGGGAGFQSGQVIPFDLPGNEWVGMYLYEEALGRYSIAQYWLRPGTTVPGLRKNEVWDVVKEDVRAQETQLAFSPDNSSINILCNINNAQMGHYNYTTNAFSLTDLTNTGIQPVKISLEGKEGWIGCFLYNSNTGLWVNEAYYTMWCDVPLPVHTLTYLYCPDGATIDGQTSVTQYVVHDEDATTVTAIPNPFWRFVRWSDGVTDNPRRDTRVRLSFTVTPEMELVKHTVTYDAGTGGSISGPSPQSITHGHHSTTVTAVANTGYVFTKWSDNSTDNPRRDYNILGDISVTAQFEPEVFTLTYVASGPGSINGTFTTVTQQVAYGEDATTVTAVPNVEVSFIGWSDFYPGTVRRDTNVTGDLTVFAYFGFGQNSARVGEAADIPRAARIASVADPRTRNRRR